MDRIKILSYMRRELYESLYIYASLGGKKQHIYKKEWNISVF